MKENTFTEKDSLELMTQMIRQSKKNMRVGSGNELLYYGYPAVVLAMVVYLAIHITGNGAWSLLWFLMFLPSVWINLVKKRSAPQVVTHIDKAVGSVWLILGMLFFLSTVGIVAMGMVTGMYYFTLMLPLSLLYAGIGMAITGVITDFKLIVYAPLVAFAAAIYMLITLMLQRGVPNWWNLIFGAVFLLMMVIPGHLLNHKLKEPC